MKRTLVDLEKEDPHMAEALTDLVRGTKALEDLFTKRYQEPPWHLRTDIIKQIRQALNQLDKYDKPKAGGGA